MNLNTKPPEDIFLTSLHSTKNGAGNEPTNDTRNEDAPWIDQSQQRAQKIEDRWVYTTSHGVTAEGTPATSDATDPRRGKRGAVAAKLPPKSEPPPVPKGPIGRN